MGTVLMEEKGERPTVVLGKDTRISSDLLEAALIAGLCSVGCDVKPVGDIPTPAVAYLTRQEKADAGIVVSAAHHRYEYNGIKVFNGQGYKLPDALEERVEEKILSDEPMAMKTRGELGLHEFCRNHGIDLVCTAVGDRNVLEELLRRDFRRDRGPDSGHGGGQDDRNFPKYGRFSG